MKPPRPILSIKTKPKHEIEAERLAKLLEKHRNRQREADRADVKTKDFTQLKSFVLPTIRTGEQRMVDER